MVDENHVSGLRTSQSDNQMLYTEAERPRGRGGRGGSACNSSATNMSRKEGIEEVPRKVLDPPQAGGVVAEPKIDKTKVEAKCWYCGKKGQKESKCWKKHRFGENQIRIRADQTRKLVAIALRRRIARIRKSRKGASLRDETRGKFDEEDHPENRTKYGMLTPERQTI